MQTFDEANPGAGWTTAPPLNHGRAHHNTVQLPDRSMVTVGGGYGILNGNRRSGDAAIHRNIELYDAATGQWTLGPAQDELRTYHSTALLLPDGRVMSAGDDGYGGSSNDTAEIYEPPVPVQGPATLDRFRSRLGHLRGHLHGPDFQRCHEGRPDGAGGGHPRERHEPAPRPARGHGAVGRGR